MPLLPPNIPPRLELVKLEGLVTRSHPDPSTLADVLPRTASGWLERLSFAPTIADAPAPRGPRKPRPLPPYPAAWDAFGARRRVDERYDLVRASAINSTALAGRSRGGWSQIFEWTLSENQLADPAVPVMWDFTGGAFGAMCNARRFFPASSEGAKVLRVCTRVLSSPDPVTGAPRPHTGRHAAAVAGRVVAVWERA